MIHRGLVDAYAFIFSRKCFHKLNKELYHASLRGLGLLNYRNDVESGESHFRKWYLSRLLGPTVIDVGANEGSFAASVLKVNSGATVFAFEPHPETYKRLALRASELKNLIPINAACGNCCGELVLYDYRGASGTAHASLHAGVIDGLHHGEPDGRIVSVVALDAFAEERGISMIDLLKIDTEGHELEVLKGAATMLQQNRVKAIQFEFNTINVISRVFFSDFRDLLPGYRFFRLVRDGLLPLDPYSPVTCEVFAFQNIVALPNGVVP